MLGYQQFSVQVILLFTMTDVDKMKAKWTHFIAHLIPNAHCMIHDQSQLRGLQLVDNMNIS